MPAEVIKEASLLGSLHCWIFPLLLPSRSGSSSSVWQKVMSLCHKNALGSVVDGNEKIFLPQGNHWKNLC